MKKSFITPHVSVTRCLLLSFWNGDETCKVFMIFNGSWEQTIYHHLKKHYKQSWRTLWHKAVSLSERGDDQWFCLIPSWVKNVLVFLLGCRFKQWSHSKSCFSGSDISEWFSLGGLWIPDNPKEQLKLFKICSSHRVIQAAVYSTSVRWRGGSVMCSFLGFLCLEKSFCLAPQMSQHVSRDKTFPVLNNLTTHWRVMLFLTLLPNRAAALNCWGWMHGVLHQVHWSSCVVFHRDEFRIV